MDEQSSRSGGDIWGASGSTLEASGTPLRVIRESFTNQLRFMRERGDLEGLRLSRHLGGTWRSDLRACNTSQLRCKTFKL
jgi:hypothetical protein